MIVTNRIVFRPVQPADYLQLYAIESDPTTAMTWRYRGNMPDISEYEPALWQQTQQIMVVQSRATGEILGYVQLHDLDLRAGHGWFSLYAGPEHRGSGIVMEGAMAFCEWVFTNWPIRWLYAHSFEHNVYAFESAVRRGITERLGVLSDRMVVDGELTDVHVIGMQRDNWMDSAMRRRFNDLRARQGNVL